MILQCIEWALRDGCHTQLLEALTSERFQELVEVQGTIFTRYSKESDQGIALRAGHLLMGELFNTHSEAEALKLAQTRRSQYGHGVDHRALVAYLGEKIVETATACLTLEIKQLAAEWQEADAERQLAITHQLFRILRSESQEARGDLTMAAVWKKMEQRMRRIDDARAILPGLYGKWDPEKCPANCQGKTQMLTAFARLAGANVMVASPVSLARDGLDRLIDASVDMVREDIVRRGLELGSELFFEGIRANCLERQIDCEDFFHSGVAIQLKDGRWVQVDPHVVSWGVFSDDWNLTETYIMLQKYGEALPGLQLHRHDNGFYERLFMEKMAKVTDLVERSRKMEKRLQAEGVDTVLGLYPVLIDSEDFDLLLKIDAESSGSEPPDLSQPDLRQYAAMVIAVGGEEKMWDMPFLSADSAYHKKQIAAWLTFYHAVALNSLIKLTESGGFVHPACEFGKPEYHIAINAINSLEQDMTPRRSSATNEFFVGYSFDQVTLNNALLEIERRGDMTLGQAACEALRALPFVHPLCQRKLDRIV